MTHARHTGVVQRFFRFLDNHELTGERVAIAFSGGPDSTALLICAKEAERAGRIEHAAALHIDHGVRPESAGDARSAADLAATIGVPFHVVHLDLNTDASEATMRAARYAALVDLAQTNGLGRLMTAHHRNDQAETVLLHLVRGSGLTGLGGIDPVSTLSTGSGDLPLYRPFLAESPHTLAELVEASGLQPIIDPTNAETDKTRNFLRHEILPRLESTNPGIQAHLANLGDLARADDEFLADAARTASTTVVRDSQLDSRALAKLPVALQRRVIRLWVAQQADVELTFDRCEAVRLAAIDGAGDIAVQLGGGWSAHQRDRTFTLRLLKPEDEEQQG